MVQAGQNQVGSNWTPEYMVVAIVSLDRKPIADCTSALVVACGRCENTDMKFGSDRRTVGRDWGKPPVRIEMVGGVLYGVPLPLGKYTLQTLSPDGTASGQVELKKVTEDGGTSERMVLSPQSKTMWYLLTRKKD